MVVIKNLDSGLIEAHNFTCENSALVVKENSICFSPKK